MMIIIPGKPGPYKPLIHQAIPLNELPKLPSLHAMHKSPSSSLLLWTTNIIKIANHQREDALSQ